ncbi:MAG: hypothetical protein LBQ66_06610, partial [Planctomycetaceae bacterium]|nr:hypothetical protein [Planctomycetaceae bacterium]
MIYRTDQKGIQRMSLPLAVASALCAQHVYEHDEEFKSFTKAVNDVKSREVMRPCAYLLPPKQRTISRFMNFSGVVDWASNMLRVFSQLQENEQNIFSFLLQYVLLINELQMVFGYVNKVLQH